MTMVDGRCERRSVVIASSSSLASAMKRVRNAITIPFVGGKNARQGNLDLSKSFGALSDVCRYRNTS